MQANLVASVQRRLSLAAVLWLVGCGSTDPSTGESGTHGQTGGSTGADAQGGGGGGDTTCGGGSLVLDGTLDGVPLTERYPGGPSSYGRGGDSWNASLSLGNGG